MGTEKIKESQMWLSDCQFYLKSKTMHEFQTQPSLFIVFQTMLLTDAKTKALWPLSYFDVREALSVKIRVRHLV